MAVLKKRNLIIIAVIILVIAIVLSSFVYLNSQKPYEKNIESVTVGFLPIESTSLVAIANDQQYFTKYGLNVTVKSYPSGFAAVQGLLNGEVNIAGAAEFVLAQAALQNEGILTIGTFSKTFNLFVIARTDMGINAISDLKGKNIGVPV